MAAEAPNDAPFAPPQQPQPIPIKSDSEALCKTLAIVLFLLAIPLFPSQAPDFITQGVFADFWEIIRLLFIGIAVSYGLFGRRTAQISTQRFVDDSRSYLPEISHLSSIFDDRYGNLCYEHDMMPDNVNYADQLLENDECVVDSGRKIRSLVPNEGNESVSEGNGNQTWRSQYSKGESLVVVSNAKCYLGGNSDFKPLNLPIRSLRSRDLNNIKQEFKNRSELSSSKSEVKDHVDGGDKVVKIRGVVPMNLEKRFEEVAGQSPIPWRSRSMMMQNDEEEMSISKQPARCRPHSVGEFEFEHLKSRSLRGSKFPSTPELRSSTVRNLERRRVYGASHLEVQPVDSEESSSSMFSNSASSDMEDLESNLESSGVEEEVRKGKQAIESLETDDAKSSSLSKVVPRAKSVRTIKPRRYVNQKEHCTNRVDNKLGRRFFKSEGDPMIKRNEEEPEVPQADHQNQECGRIFSMPKPKPTLPEFFNEDKQDIEALHSSKAEDTEISSEMSLNVDDDRTYTENDGELGSEVDRKAGEFIAKFREQIRRQKTSSSLYSN